MPSLCLTLLLLATGCAGASERVAGWYVTRRLDAYFDFDSAQKAKVRASVDETIRALRRSELPHWITFLREVRQGIHDGLTEQSLARLQRRYDERLDVGVQLLAPRLSPMLESLTAQQVEHFTKEVRRDIDAQYEELELTPAKRSAKLEERGVDAIEDLVGSLDDPQEEALRGLIRALPNERDLQYQSAKAHVEQFRAFLLRKPTRAAIETELRAMWDGRYDALGPGRDKASRRAVQRRWMLSVLQLLTPAQRAHAEAQLSARISTLKRWLLPAERELL